MTKNAFQLTCLITAVTALSGLCGCASIEARHTKAEKLASVAQMHKQLIEADPFILTVYERTNHKDKTATVYIEGDGLAWTGRRVPSADPTPTNPVALALAAKDISANVIYMARPCQYSGLSATKPCPSEYWTSKRFAPDVLHSMSLALDNIKTRHGINDFNLVGFSGGAAIAALLTASRNDVTSLRTVAGNLDHVRLHNNHNVSQTPKSLNSVDIAAAIADVPQHHFIGGSDKIITPDIYGSFRGAAGPSTCIRSSIIRNAAHEKGWTEDWPALLQYKLDCMN